MKSRFEDTKELDHREILKPGRYQIEWLYPRMIKVRDEVKIETATKLETLAKDGLKIISIKKIG